MGADHLFGRIERYSPARFRLVTQDCRPNHTRRAIGRSCERCARRDNIECDVIVPVAAERERINVRRLVKIQVRKSPVWRDG